MNEIKKSAIDIRNTLGECSWLQVLIPPAERPAACTSLNVTRLLLFLVDYYCNINNNKKKKTGQLVIMRSHPQQWEVLLL